MINVWVKNRKDVLPLSTDTDINQHALRKCKENWTQVYRVKK